MLSNKYVAGLFDADGCLNVDYNKQNGHYNVRATFSMVHLGILELLKTQFGGNIQGPVRRGNNSKPFWIWRLTGPNLTAFLECVKPFVEIKKEQVRVASAMRTSLEAYGEMTFERLELRKALKEEMHDLNKRGL